MIRFWHDEADTRLRLERRKHGKRTAQAQLTGFVASPTTNSVDFTGFVSARGGVINANLNFDAMPTGPLQNTFYTTSDGVTFSTVGDANQVRNGAGPGQSNTTEMPLSPGEGPHAPSHFLRVAENASSLTLSFDRQVSGVGLFTVDLFNTISSLNPSGYNPLTIEAYSGQNATGTLLGTFNAATFNFQPNNLYFLGLATDDGSNSIGSFVFRNRIPAYTSNADAIGIDDIRFARTPAVSTVPEPSEYAAASLFGATLLVGMVKARRRKATASA